MPACLIMLFLVFATGCPKSEGVKTERVRVAVTGLQTLVVSATTVPEVVEAIGTLRSRNAAQISARVAGTISSLRVQEGDRVKKGRLLLTITSAETSAGAASALAMVEQARHALDEAQTRRVLAEHSYARYDQLYREEAITRQEYDHKLAERDVAKQSVARAEAALAGAQEGSRGASALAGYTKVTTPIDGIISSRLVDVGMTVFPGSHLVTIEDDSNYRLEVAVPASLLGKIRVAAPVAVRLDGNSADVMGMVEEIVPTVDSMTRTFVVKIAVSTAGVRSGSYGSARFPVGSRSVLLVPKGALVEQGALTSVWVVGEDTVIRMRVIRPGRNVNDQVEVMAGLKPGETIITAGLEKVVEGATLAQN